MFLAGISTRDGTAKKDKDFRGKAQKQVQFNPGQTLATWRVRILIDGEHERSESFQIVLSEPVMAVLEFPSVSTVEIIDPGDGKNCYRTVLTICSYCQFEKWRANAMSSSGLQSLPSLIIFLETNLGIQ